MKSVHKYLLRIALLFWCIGNSLNSIGHPMPNTVFQMDVKSEEIVCELQLPLKDLELSFGKPLLSEPYHSFKANYKDLKTYILNHLKVTSKPHNNWNVQVLQMKLGKVSQTDSGPYQELIVKIKLIPPPGCSTRNFILHYDAIIHQVVTHKALVSISDDLDQKKSSGRKKIRVIGIDVVNNTIPPMEISLDNDKNWKGFTGMLLLGMEHIKEGTDHLMFLLVLLLPAAFIAKNSQWTVLGDTKYMIKQLVRIITAFTVGHSITLILGALGWIHFPSKPIEILIAISISVSAIHALRPVFAGKEIYIVLFFGLIHGMAFAGTLENLHLPSDQMVMSILGFNVGIEIMQLFILLLTVPWLVILSEFAIYRWIRIGGASFAFFASIGWILERITERSNAVTEIVGIITRDPKWLILALMLTATGFYLYKNYFQKSKNTPKS